MGEKMTTEIVKNNKCRAAQKQKERQIRPFQTGPGK